MTSRIKILNGEFAPLTLDETVEELINQIKRGERGWLCTVNVAILMMMRDDSFLQDFADKASLVVADGQPLIWTAPVFGKSLPVRVAGVDLVSDLSKRCAEEGYGVYFLGAEDTIVKKVAEKLQEEIPALKISGTADGYFTEDEASDRAKAISASGANVLFVGMGVPRQEHFIATHWENLGVQVAIGVGGSFDVIAGLRKRAPVSVQRVGLEWLYRLIQEPRRLAGRYAETNSRFIYLVARELAASLFASKKKPI